MQKNILVVISVFFIVFLSGCTQPTEKELNPENKKIVLQLKFSPGTALVNQATIIPLNQASNVVNVVKTITFPLNVFEDHASVKSVMLEAFALSKGEKIDRCPEISLGNKASIFSIYHDGKIDAGQTAKTNYFLPQKEIDLNEEWVFQGITYKFSKIVDLNREFWPKKAARIDFSGVYNDRDVNGYYLFDYENGRFLFIERKETGPKLGGGRQGLKLVTELLKELKDFNAENYTNKCLEAKKQEKNLKEILGSESQSKDIAKGFEVLFEDSNAWVEVYKDKNIQKLNVLVSITNNNAEDLNGVSVFYAKLRKDANDFHVFKPDIFLRKHCKKIEQKKVQDFDLPSNCRASLLLSFENSGEQLKDFNGKITTSIVFNASNFVSPPYRTKVIPVKIVQANKNS